MNEVNLSPQEAVARYEQLKIEIKEREMELDMLKELVQSVVPEDTELITEQGYFYIQKRPRYVFSEVLGTLHKDIKEREKEEIRTGVAEVHYTNVLYYKLGRPKGYGETAQ